MVVQRQNPAYRLAPPTRRLMRRVPGAPGVGPVLKQLRKEKGPSRGLFLFCRTARGPNTWGLARLPACWKTLVCPRAEKESEAQAGWVLRAQVRRCARAQHLGLARLPACWEAPVCPHVKRKSEAQASWVLSAQVRRYARAQHPGPCSSSSLLGARRGT